MLALRQLSSALLLTGVVFFAPQLSGCSGPCDKACEVLVRECGLAADSYSAAPQNDALRGCDQVEPGVELDEAICLEQCQEWQAEGTECLAALSCGEDPAQELAAVAACMDGRGREHNERDAPDSDPSDCRQDCDRQAEACGGACATQHGDTATCAGCFDNCDKGRARCRWWCDLIGQ